MKNITQSLKIIVLSIILSFGLSYVYAWTAPTVSAPGGNVSAPINTGDNMQYKAGGLVLNNSASPFPVGLAVLYGNVGIGTTAPGSWAAPGSFPIFEVNGAIGVSGNDNGSGLSSITSEGGGHPLRLKARAGNYPDLLVGTNGNVGLGVAVPQQNLSVSRYLNVDQSDSDIGATGVFHGIIFGSNSGESIGSNRNMASASYGGLDFYTAWAKRMSIAEISGNVGIGTETPDKKLTIQEGATGDPQLFLKQNNANHGYALGSSAQDGDLRFYRKVDASETETVRFKANGDITLSSGRIIFPDGSVQTKAPGKTPRVFNVTVNDINNGGGAPCLSGTAGTVAWVAACASRYCKLAGYTGGLAQEWSGTNINDAAVVACF